MEWPRGEAAACKAAYTGSNPVSTSVFPIRFRMSARMSCAAWHEKVARRPLIEEITDRIVRRIGLRHTYFPNVAVDTALCS